MKSKLHCYIFAAALLLCTSFAHSQNVRWDLGSPGSAGAVTTTGSGTPFLVAEPAVGLNWCLYPANSVPCTNYANTYPSFNSNSPCATSTPIVLQGSNTCVATGDNFGNLGVYAPPGNYSYTLTVNGASIGPYNVSLGNGAGSGFEASPQLGDIFRYNVNADGLWDTVNYAAPFVSVYAVLGSSPQSIGPLGTGNVNTTGNNTADVNPTATSGPGKSIGETGGNASTSTVAGLSFGANGNNSRIGMQAFYRWTAKIALGTLTNSRFWMGLATYDNSGTGGNTAAIVGSTAYATNTPNKSTEGFRCANGTDTTWQAVVITAGASSGLQTTVNTGVACDTNIHLFEMVPNSTGTAIQFFIDLNLVATISTNLPPPANGANSWGDLFLVGDNEDSSSAISVTFYLMEVSLKP